MRLEAGRKLAGLGMDYNKKQILEKDEKISLNAFGCMCSGFLLMQRR